MKKIKVVLKIVFLFLLFFILIGIYFYRDYKINENYKTSNIDFNTGQKEIVSLRISHGMSTRSIAKMLKSKKLIKNELYFLIFIKLTNNEENLKAGVYEFDSNVSLKEIVNKLINGKERFISINIPEGFNSYDIVERLEEKGLGKKEKFLEIIEKNNLEGYLYPDTYFFSDANDEKAILEKMTKNFENKTKQLFNKNNNLKMKKKDIIILASIIEKEAVLDRERSIIASVFYNRIKKNIPLQSCATVQYIIQGRTGERKKRLFYSDLRIKSDCNTYRNKGLPKKPICSPGFKSIEAAINPSTTNYLFFVRNIKRDGTHIFSATYQEHVLAKKTNII
jgi:UPF0755 protein